jgi:hypothetical protein
MEGSSRDRGELGRAVRDARACQYEEISFISFKPATGSRFPLHDPLDGFTPGRTATTEMADGSGSQQPCRAKARATNLRGDLA